MTDATPRRQRWAVASAAVIGAIALLLQRSYPVGLFHDDGAYAILAGAAANGGGLTFLHLPGTPYNVHYPPVYPLLLSVIWRFTDGFPRNVGALLALNALAVTASAYLLHRIATEQLRWTALPATIFACAALLTLPLLLLNGTLLSEPLFLAALLGALLWGERLLARPAPMIADIAFGLGCGLLMLVRTQGLTLVIAVGLVVGLRQEWRRLLTIGLAAAIPLFGWQAWVAAHATPVPLALEGSYGSYLGWFFSGFSEPGFLPRTMRINAISIWSLVGGRFSIFSIHVAAVVASVAFATGLWRVRHRAPLIALTTMAYLGIVAIWPYTPWRFVYGVWPVILLVIAEGLRCDADALRSRRARAVVGAAAGAVLVAGMAVQEFRAWRGQTWRAPSTIAGQQALPSLQWILGHTRPSDLIASEASELVYLYTGRRSVPVMPFVAAEYGIDRGPELDAAGLGRVVSELPVDYVVTLSAPLRSAASRVTKPSLVLVDSINGGAAFRVQR